ncbi:MAG TPA: PAC2 family protein [Mycobacteriales bacterium]|nr:PAC2 family protein [Mycobacteriales bacterium]
MALDPRELFELAPDAGGLGRPVLVQALDGFVDAGGARRLARDHLLASDEGARVVATFDVDQLHDYRARRPPMLFVEDHWESYEAPELVVHALRDAHGTPYLLLSGPEPDVQWERFATAVRLLVEALGVRLTVGLNAIPMAVPHTRPVGVIAHGSRRDLVAGFEPWVATVQVPGAAGHLIEYRLGRAGHDAAGFAVHVPHYVAQAPYPAAAEVLVQSVARVSGLVLPTDALAAAAAETRRLIDEQVAEAAEVAAVVRALEEQYDTFVSGRRNLLAEGGSLPTGDELGAELERFLAEQPRPDTG